jgi:hypothetical protein
MTCPWCYSPATDAVWTPRHGWVDVCGRHGAEVRRDVTAYFIDRLTH